MPRTRIRPSALPALLLGAVSLGAPGCVYSEAIRQGDNLLLRERAPFEPTRSELAAPKLTRTSSSGWSAWPAGPRAGAAGT
ncbi:MAG: hypothetical protein R3F62_26415 [Planctomycetota bacterium]